jgi:hypothetical protein
LPSYISTDLSTGLLMMVCGDVIRPSLSWMLTRTHRYLSTIMAEVRDPDGFAQLAELAASQPHSGKDAQIAATRIATVLACKGGLISDITVGDCVELFDTQRRVHVRGGQHKVDFYLRLRALGVFPEDAPATIRAFGQALGQLSIEELVDRYPINCHPVRDLLVDYLRERQPSLDFASLDAISRTLAGLFWSRIEALSPGINSLRLSPALARAWKEDLSVKTRTTIGPDGATVEVTSTRLNAKDELMRVRALYLDIAHWAAEEVGCHMALNQDRERVQSKRASNALQNTIKCRPACGSPVRLTAGEAPISVLPHEHQEEALHSGQPAGAPDRRLICLRVHVEEP